MSNLILHHYPNSPFAEKIRLILGWKNLAWQSCDAPVIMPKPELQALTGGYRRIPVLQIGADVYCDTLLISDLLESIQPTPSIYPAGCEGVARAVAQWADSALFSAAMAYNFSPKGSLAFAEQNAGVDLKAFATDRAAMRGGAPRMFPGDATGIYKVYLQRIGALRLTGTRNCSVSGSLLVNLGGTGVMVSGWNVGAAVSDCEFRWLGDSAVIGAWGLRESGVR